MFRRSISDTDAAWAARLGMQAFEVDPNDAEIDLDQFVSAFETAHVRGAAEDLADFLPSSQHPQYLEILCEIVRIDLEFHWRGGRPRRLADYSEKFPELFASRQTLEAVCFEEYRLRRLAGEAVSPREYQQRYGLDTGIWAAPDTCSSRGAAADRARRNSSRGMPRAGDTLLGFELIRELGRGSFATVFLARQAELADRPVALKISCEQQGESQILARLQHTNIVPIHSTHQAGDLRLVCMAYFGATTLADVLRLVRDRGGLPPSGAQLVDTLRKCRDISERDKPPRNSAPERTTLVNSQSGGEAASAIPVRAAGLRAIAALDYVPAVVWIAARLAEGLQHAHERGVLHLDLKPANVLMADDGQPMLLDFNLSQTIRGGHADYVGGTLAYMAPENLAAYWHGACGGDARGDIYSLGVLLFELLTGQLPFPFREGAEDEALEAMTRDRRAPPPSPRRLNRAVSPAVDAIVRKCLMPGQEARYATAAALHEDLERHLRSLPLRHVREPSLAERAAKFLRRHPGATSATGIASMAALLLALMAVGLAVRGSRLAAFESSAALAGFRNDFRAAQVAALDAPSAAHARLDKVDAACRKALDHFRVLDDPAWPDAAVVRRLSPQGQDEVRADVGELLFLLAAVTRLDAEPATSGCASQSAGIERAMELNRRAEGAWPASQAPGAIWRQRASFAADLGDGELARQSLQRAASASPDSTRNVCMAACLLVSQRRFGAALPLWEQATRGDPQNVWTWYGLGNCCQQLGQLSRAAACYTACIALKPDYDGWYSCRGTVYLKQKDYQLAAADFDEVLRLYDDRVDARVNRAIARLGLGRPREAIDDLHAALASGAERRGCICCSRGPGTRWETPTRPAPNGSAARNCRRMTRSPGSPARLPVRRTIRAPRWKMSTARCNQTRITSRRGRARCICWPNGLAGPTKPSPCSTRQSQFFRRPLRWSGRAGCCGQGSPRPRRQDATPRPH